MPIRKTLILMVGLLLLSAQVPAASTPVAPFESEADPTLSEQKIDKLVFGKLQQLGITPARLCSDGVFVRRVYLDVIGTLPTAEQARTFIESKDVHKRRALIDELLARDGDYAVYWTVKWSDILRLKAEFPVNLWPNAAQAYYWWIRQSLEANKPYDQFARELLLASGSNNYSPPANFYRAMLSKTPEGIARSVALTFMGERFDKWPKQQQEGLKAFFSRVGYKLTAEWKEEIVYDKHFPGVSANGMSSAAAVFPDGTLAALATDEDPRKIFTAWLVDPQNPWFTRNIVNRVWSWLLGRGIIHEPDDIRPDNPPSNPELLAYLEEELIASRYDLKALYRLILNSQTYQLSSIPRSDHPRAAEHFACYPLRRLEAEVLIDAIDQITGSKSAYISLTPEPWTYVPKELRTIALRDGGCIAHKTLEMFGRSPRESGLEAERINDITREQRMFLLNSNEMRTKIASMASGHDVQELYLKILSRFPTAEERKTAANLAEQGINLEWYLINQSEFYIRH